MTKAFIQELVHQDSMSHVSVQPIDTMNVLQPSAELPYYQDIVPPCPDHTTVSEAP